MKDFKKEFNSFDMNKVTIISLLFFLLSQVISAQTEIIQLGFDTSGYGTNSTPATPPTSPEFIPSIKGDINVNQSGALTYVLPIEVMKGINNHQPNLALAYSSQGGNGQAGWGWNIMGLSIISRGGKSKDIDGITMGPQFDETDPYYLDGQRLLQVSPTIFETEKYSKIKIDKQDASSDFSFIVKYTDGKIAKYKEIVSGQHYISELIDALDNEIHYTYSTSFNVPIVTSISYGGDTTTNDTFFINFLYNNRAIAGKSYRNGVEFKATKVLSEIKISSNYLTSNNGLYRRYKLFYDKIQGNAVERLIKIEVENETGISLKPLYFNYNNTSYGTIELQFGLLSLPNSFKGLGSVAVGDFYGKGTPYPLYETKHVATSLSFQLRNPVWETPQEVYDSTRDYFTGRSLNNNKIAENDELFYSYVDYLGTGSNLVDHLTIKSKNLANGYSKEITMDLPGGLVEEEVHNPDPYDYENDGTEYDFYRDKEERKFISGDFNNDGLVDIFIVENANLNRPERLYFCEIGKAPAGAVIPIEIPIQGENIFRQTFYQVEFDGDGISEFLVVNKSTQQYSVYKFDPINYTLTSIPSQTNIALSNFDGNTPFIFGDFNGDGLTDFLTPTKTYSIEGSTAEAELQKMETEQLLWWEYIATGVTYVATQKDYTQQKLAYIRPSQRNIIKRSSGWSKFWSGQPDTYDYTEYGSSNIIPVDFNNDGKTDLVSVRKFGKAKYPVDGNLRNTAIQSLNTFGSVNAANANRIFFHENKTLANGTQQFSNLSETIDLSNVDISPMSMFINYTNHNQLNSYKSGILIHDPVLGTDRKYIFNTDEFTETQIREIDNGSPVLQKIEYKPMVEENNDNREVFYTTSNINVAYPYYIHKNIGTNYLVSKTHVLFDDTVITKEYRYQNGIQHLSGKGFLGFQKTFISDPYESILVNEKYQMKDFSRGLFWTTNVYNPLLDNVLAASMYGSLDENSIFTKSQITSQRFDKGGNRYLILATSEINEDYLKDVTIIKSYEYETSQDLLLKQINTNYNSIGSSIEKYTYVPEFNNGEHYFFGKITKTENTLVKGSDIFTTKEEQLFNPNGTVLQTKKYGHETLPIIEDYTYYPFGGIETQTISADGITPVVTSFEYDATNRYIWKTTMPDGMESIVNINPTGRTTSEVSPLGHTTSYLYDDWGNVEEITDYLGKTTTIQKNTVSDGIGYYSISTTQEGGGESIVIMDAFDRVIKSKSKAINDQWVISEVEYDVFGNKIKQSEPYFDGETILWNTIEYDDLDRAIKHTSFTGKVMTTCYEGLKVSVEDGHKKTSKWLDAMGNVVRHQDAGGEIYYSYYANGSLKETNYEGIITKVEIDGWGNKTKLIDPSAGTYSYEYDNLNRIKKQTNPKGGVTQYVYDDIGRLQSENTTSASENTTIVKNYYYDPTTNLPTVVSGTYNDKSYTYTTFYDDIHYRVTGKKEETPDFTYETTLTYDDFGRVDVTELKTTLNNPSYVTTSQVKNVYDTNGILVRQLDNVSSMMIWEVSSANSHGFTTQMQYGNGYTLNTSYTNNLLLENIHHFNDTQSVVNTNYNYDNLRGVLLSRNNLIFGKDETYEYDDLDRLLEEATNGVVTQEYTYDNRGRMTSNTDIGKYNYNQQDYKLQNVDFNANGAAVNTDRGFAEIQYNAFKNPNEIFLEGKDRISYDYSILKTRSASYYGSVSVTATDRPNRKYYSSDKAVEIIKEGNTTKVITYITGDAYSANYMKVGVLEGASLVSNDNYFLHRDNQATILAITKASIDGTVIEKRYFDAWGNLKEALIGSVTTVVTPDAMGWVSQLLIDRGYTGHEHLKTVGLVHMNGRIYDPLLRRFMSPDNYVQDPYNTQSYNRYGYVWNNPLLFIDPSGEIGFLAAVGIGVAIGVIVNGINNVMHGVPFWYGTGKAGVIGGVSGAISFGIGSAATDAFGQYLTAGKAAFQAGAHGVTGGLMSSIEGGDFNSGFISGALSSLVSSGVGYIGESGGMYLDEGYTQWTDFGTENPGLMKAITIASGGLSGGIGSTIAGGNFWSGARQGLITSGLNHLAHSIYKRKTLLERFKKDKNGKYIVDPDGKPDFTKEGVKKLNKAVEGLEAAYIKGGWSEVGFEEKYEYGQTYADGTIQLNRDLITSNYIYAAILFHEYRHAWQYLVWSHDMDRAISKYQYWGKKYGWDTVWDLMERDAYKFQIDMGAGDVAHGYLRYNDYYNATKSINID